MKLSPVLPSTNISPDYLVGELTLSVYRLQLQRNAMDDTKTLRLWGTVHRGIYSVRLLLFVLNSCSNQKLTKLYL